jgi:hypothetical protein
VPVEGGGHKPEPAMADCSSRGGDVIGMLAYFSPFTFS